MPDKTIREYFLRLPAEERRVSEMRDFVAEACTRARLSERDIKKVQMCAEEAFTNVIRHAYLFGPGWIQIKAEVRPSSLALSVIDHGRSFDFDAVERPDLSRLIARERKGGLGILMIRTLMDEVDYRVGREGNVLRMVKYCERPTPDPASKRRRLTLRGQFMLTSSVFMTLVAGGICAYVLGTSGRVGREQVLERSLAVAKSLANNASALLIGPEHTPDWGNVNVQVLAPRAKAEQPWIDYVCVVGNDRIVYSHSEPESLLTTYLAPPGVLDRPGVPQRFARKQPAGGRSLQELYDVSAAIRLENGTSLGTVHLGILEEVIQGQVRSMRARVLGVALALLALGMVAVGSASSVLVKPIQKLMDGVRTVGSGDLEHYISLSSDDEIGQIARAFNDMTRRFRNSQRNVVEQERIRKEMQVAQEIQQTLLPARFPEVDGYEIATLYRAAKEVGGDYYDFVWVNKDVLGVVVADVSGKGVPGSLIMTMIRTALRREALGNRSAKEVLQNVNAFVAEDMRHGMFVTIFYVILDSRKRVISFASAGHNPMILYRGGTGEAYFLNPPGVPLGLSLPDQDLFPQTLELERTRLHKGDLLIVHTDGVTEAMNRSREQFGTRRLFEFVRAHAQLSPAEFVKQLDGEISQFTEGYAQSDDLTMVVIQEKLDAGELFAQRWREVFEGAVSNSASARESALENGVSLSTYYHYRKVYQERGEEGLRALANRDSQFARLLSVRERNRVLEVVKLHPDFGPTRISEELASSPEALLISPTRVYDELRRLKLNTRSHRREFARGDSRPVLHVWDEAEQAPANPSSPQL
jgi:serine phosphatase RsbU (regulator of sigma subunit)/anti-sigma regulatory factor (Ser/Thr protein kinase)/transposase